MGFGWDGWAVTPGAQRRRPSGFLLLLRLRLMRMTESAEGKEALVMDGSTVLRSAVVGAALDEEGRTWRWF